MARRRNFDEMQCSVARALDVVGEWWALLVVREAFRGVRRFDAFVEQLGIAPNILAARLRRLVEAGVLEPRKYADRPERFEYRLTKKGRDLFPVILALMHWGDRWCGEDGPPVALVHAACGKRTHARAVCAECGEPLEARATYTEPFRRDANSA